MFQRSYLNKTKHDNHFYPRKKTESYISIYISNMVGPSPTHPYNMYLYNNIADTGAPAVFNH